MPETIHDQKRCSRLMERRPSLLSSAMNLKLAIAISVVVLSFMCYRLITKTFPIPELDTKKYFGPGDASNYVEDESVKPFKINFKQEVIDDLKSILDRPLRLQEPIEDAGFTYGFNSKKMTSLVDYWRNIYLPKWSARQEYLNKFQHYTTQINGLNIHFIHAKAIGKAPSADHIRIPLLLLHGWPGSVREFYDFIPKLINYSDKHKFVFDVIAPSLAGYGFSSAPAKKGFVIYEMATVMRNLMLRLGYNKFVIQGGDWGSIIGSQLATLFPDNVIGYHSNLCIIRTPLSIVKSLIASVYPSLFVKPEHHGYYFPLSEKFSTLMLETGYFHIQATKPDTVGIALASSPVGLAAYILEKFSTGTNKKNRDLENGGLDNLGIDMDALLDNIMIYYLNNKITSSMRFYAEAMSKQQAIMSVDRITSYVPMGCTRFSNDLTPVFDWQLKDKFPNLIHSSHIDNGGHFAAMEVPDVLYNEFIEFVGKVYQDK